MKTIEKFGEYELVRASSKEDGREFYADMGRFFCSREIAKELGGPMYDGEEYEWIQVRKGREVVGFGAVRMYKNGTAFLDWTYINPEHRRKGLYKKLFAVREKFAREELQARAFRTATRTDFVRTWFEKQGFEKSQDRGEWSYYQKEVA